MTVRGKRAGLPSHPACAGQEPGNDKKDCHSRASMGETRESRVISLWRAGINAKLGACPGRGIQWLVQSCRLNQKV